MSHCVDDTYDVYFERERKARKEHRCDACNERITPGHYYTSVHIVFDGSAESIKRCARCQTLHVHLRDLGVGDTWPDEKLACGQNYEYEWGTCPPEIQALAFALPGEEP